MKKLKWIRRFTTASGILTGISFFINFGFEKIVTWYLKSKHNMTVNFQSQGANSIGIIGGADGPTSIFVASYSKDNGRFLGMVVSLLLSLVTVLGFVLYKKTKKQIRK